MNGRLQPQAQAFCLLLLLLEVVRFFEAEALFFVLFLADFLLLFLRGLACVAWASCAAARRLAPDFLILGFLLVPCAAFEAAGFFFFLAVLFLDALFLDEAAFFFFFLGMGPRPPR